MTAAAFQATFSDFRVVKGRKVAQWIFETPIEAADSALEALGGIPQPQKETWVGIARINLEGSSTVEPRTVNAVVAGSNPAPPAKERRSWSSLSYAEQAGIRCQEPSFWQFLTERVEGKITNANEAAEVVRAQCSVESRSQIRPGTKAERHWITLDETYESWLRRQTF